MSNEQQPDVNQALRKGGARMTEHQPMTAEQMAEIEQALDAATAGPWKWSGDKWGDPVVYSPELRGFHNNGGEIAGLENCSANDAHLIAHAPTWLRSLLAEVQRLTELNQASQRRAEEFIVGERERLSVEVQRLSEESEKWRKEALQQYPTPEAYDAACAALHKHRERADTAEAEVQRQHGEIERLSAEQEENEHLHDENEGLLDEIERLRNVVIKAQLKEHSRLQAENDQLRQQLGEAKEEVKAFQSEVREGLKRESFLAKAHRAADDQLRGLLKEGEG